MISPGTAISYQPWLPTWEYSGCYVTWLPPDLRPPTVASEHGKSGNLKGTPETAAATASLGRVSRAQSWAAGLPKYGPGPWSRGSSLFPTKIFWKGWVKAGAARFCGKGSIPPRINARANSVLFAAGIVPARRGCAFCQAHRSRACHSLWPHPIPSWHSRPTAVNPIQEVQL